MYFINGDPATLTYPSQEKAPPPPIHHVTSVTPPSSKVSLKNPLPSSPAIYNTCLLSHFFTFKHNPDQIPTNNDSGLRKSSQLPKTIKTLPKTSYLAYRYCTNTPTPGGCQLPQIPNKSTPDNPNDIVRLKKSSQPLPKIKNFFDAPSNWDSPKPAKTKSTMINPK